MKGNMCERKEKERIGKCYAFEKGPVKRRKRGRRMISIMCCKRE